MSTQPTIPDLTAWQAAAARRYAKDFEKSKRDHHCRIAARDELRLARANLSKLQVAVVDMIAGRGWSVEELVRLTGRKPDDVSRLFVSALTELARHYEAGDRADAA